MIGAKLANISVQDKMISVGEDCRFMHQSQFF